jgi:sugar/nucleoside kinase (ribokinase family)
MIKVVTIGSACQDIFFPTADGVLMETPEDVLSQKKLAFELGAKYAITERFETLGGNSLNVAVGLSNLGIDVAAYSTVGDDAVGKWILRELKKTNVKIAAIKVENDCKSDLSSIIVDEKSNDRIIFSSHVANKKLVFDESRIENSEWFFLGDLSGNWQMITDDFLRFAKKKNVRIAFNPRQSTIHEDVQKVIETIYFCELLCVNKDEAIEIVKGFDADILQELLEQEEFLLKELRAMGAKVVALTDGIRGAWAYDGSNVLHAEAILQKAVDSTGAGDAFTSGFFAAYLQGKSIQTALKWGVANSSNSVTEYGGQAGLLKKNDLEHVL